LGSILTTGAIDNTTKSTGDSVIGFDRT